MRVYINIIDPTGTAKRFSVDDVPVKVGRSPLAQVTVTDPMCSGLHVMLYVKEYCLFIEDLNSKNGMILNGIKVSKQRLFVGDTVHIGESQLKIDPIKNDPLVLDALTSLAKRSHGEITLELETHQEIADRRRANLREQSSEQRRYVHSAKLYHGVSESVKTNKKENGGMGVVVKEMLANFIDLLLSGAVFGIAFVIARYFKPESGATIHAFAGMAAAILFYFWNRQRDMGSIGERIMKLD